VLALASQSRQPVAATFPRSDNQNNEETHRCFDRFCT
jgi:hypothetical protein